ncbi:cytochrome P450 [Bradyrhizobium sp. McL0615]|uniref:cytochrome P450 n=1 Tax=Bradyrhizobium sp. McL0615 TaxID=3415673 RepID=UPI003CF8ECCC
MGERAPVADWASDFDHLDPAWAEDPFPIWKELRQTCPVAHTDRFSGVYFPLRYEDIRAVAYDTDHFSSRRNTIREGNPEIPPNPPFSSDPPAHRDQRKLLLPLFTPAAIQELEPRARAICRETLEGLSGRTEFDAAVDYAQNIPTRVITHMLRLPEHEGERFRGWLRKLYVGFREPAIARAAYAEMNAFMSDHVAECRKTHGEDLIGYLFEAELNGQPLSDEYIVGTVRLLLLAGIDTTWSMVGTCLWHLATHADDRRRLVTEPHLIPTAIEEFLRAYAPALLGRVIIKDTVLGGCPLKTGEMVMLSYGAANRDPALFSEPDEIIIDRTENPHVTFGLGIHRCIGAHLARMELRVGIQEWLLKFPEFELKQGAVVEWTSGLVRGPRRIPITILH